MTETTQKGPSAAEIRKLVERGQQGDRAALEELYLIHFDRIYSYLHMTVGNRHDAEDLTTQTFLRMLESIRKFRFQSAPFSAWLFRIAHNLSMDHFRANRRWQPEEEVPEPLDSAERSAEDEAFQSIGRQSMLGLIESLSQEQQQVLTLKFVFNFSNAEAATILDKTEGAVKSLQHRALVSLQKQIAGAAPDEAKSDPSSPPSGSGTLAVRSRWSSTEVRAAGWSASGGCAGGARPGAVALSDRRPAGGGKTTLFTALTRTGGAGFGKENVGMASIADDRLDKLAALVGARKITPATIRVVDVPGTGPQLLGGLRQVDAILAVADGHSPGATPSDDFETLELELLVADRDHVERRLERVEKQAKSGDVGLRKEVEQLQALLAYLEAGNSLRDFEGELPPELEPLTTKPLIAVVNGPGGIDLKLEAELAEMSDEEAAEFRDGPSALDEVVRRLRDALDLITFFTAGDKETRAWTLRRGQTALEAAESIHSDIARGFIRCETISTDDLLAAGSHAEAAKRGTQRLEGKTYEVQDGDVLNIRFNI